MHYEVEYALDAEANGKIGVICKAASSPAEAVRLALEQLQARGISRDHVFRIAVHPVGPTKIIVT